MLGDAVGRGLDDVQQAGGGCGDDEAAFAALVAEVTVSETWFLRQAALTRNSKEGRVRISIDCTKSNTMNLTQFMLLQCCRDRCTSSWTPRGGGQGWRFT